MNELATYNLGAVLRETGINADTLRAWERRYELPTPKRTEGGHRIYSERDVETIKWLLRQQENGMRIGQAAKLWHSKIENGSDPLFERQHAPTIEDTLDTSQLGNFRQKWVNACLDFDEVKAEQISNEAFSRFSPEIAFLNIFLPAIRQVGEYWYLGKATVQQEHFASALLMRRLDALITTSPPPTRPEKVVVACPHREEHTLSALLLTLFLRRRGFHVVYLGTNVPLAEFRETVDTIQPNLIILAAQQLNTAASLQQTIQALAPCGVTIGYSGRIFSALPQLRQYTNGEFLGESFDNLFANIERLLHHGPAPSPEKATNPHQALYDTYQTEQIKIYAQLNESFSKWNVSLKQMAESTTFLSEAISASLYFGDLDLLSHELSWVQELLANRSVNHIKVEYYLQAYANATQAVMGEIAAPLVHWLKAQSQNYANT